MSSADPDPSPPKPRNFLKRLLSTKSHDSQRPLPSSASQISAEERPLVSRTTSSNSNSKRPAPARALVGGVPAAFASLGMAAYVNPVVDIPEVALPRPTVPLASKPPGMVPSVDSGQPSRVEPARSSIHQDQNLNLNVAQQVQQMEPDQSITFPQYAQKQRSDSLFVSSLSSGVPGAAAARARKQSIVSQYPASSDEGEFILCYSTVEIDYINGYTIQAHTWSPGGISFLRLTPTTQQLPPLIVPTSISSAGPSYSTFQITVHLTNLDNAAEFLHLDSSTSFHKLLSEIGKLYEQDIVDENGVLTVGLGMSIKTWNEKDTLRWLKKIVASMGEEVEEDYIEMVVSVDTPEKWAWALGVARQGLKNRVDPEMMPKIVGVEMWLVACDE